MSHLVKRSRQLYSYKDYLKLPSDNKYEIINGILYAMTPAPAIEHQRILRKIFVHIANYLEGKKVKFLRLHWMYCFRKERKEPKKLKQLYNQIYWWFVTFQN